MPHQNREGQAEEARGLVLVHNSACVCAGVLRARVSAAGEAQIEVCAFMGFGVKQWVAAEGAV
eukprot:2119428-Prymnesium_polylepis.1